MPSSARLLALAIGSHQNSRTGAAAFPSIETLVKKTGLSKATIHRMKRLLVSQGYLSEKRNYNANNEYLMMRPNILNMRVSESHGEELIENIIENIIEKIDDDSNESSLVNSLKEIKPEGVITLDANDEWFSGRTLNEAAASPRPNRWDELKKLGDELWG